MPTTVELTTDKFQSIIQVNTDKDGVARDASKPSCYAKYNIIVDYTGITAEQVTRLCRYQVGVKHRWDERSVKGIKKTTPAEEADDMIRSHYAGVEESLDGTTVTVKAIDMVPGERGDSEPVVAKAARQAGSSLKSAALMMGMMSAGNGMSIAAYITMVTTSRPNTTEEEVVSIVRNAVKEECTRAESSRDLFHPTWLELID